MKRIVTFIRSLTARLTSARASQQWALDSAVIIPTDTTDDTFAILWSEAV